MVDTCEAEILSFDSKKQLQNELRNLSEPVELGEYEFEFIEPKRTQLPPPRVFPASDLASLFWYYEFGVKRLEWPSNMGRQMEVASFYFLQMKPCTACGGDRKKWTGGTGFVTSSAEFKQRKMLADLGLVDLKMPGDMECPTCKPKIEPGETDPGPWAPGWVPGRRHAKGPVTVRSTGSSKRGSGVPSTGGDEKIYVIGRLLKVLAIVGRIDPICEEAIPTYCAPDGRNLGSLWHLTPVGRTMLRRNDQKLHYRQYFDNEKQRQKVNPTNNRELQHEAADQQAGLLWERCTTAWALALSVLEGKMSEAAAMECAP